MIPLYKRARKLSKKGGLTLAGLKANTIELFSRRDLVIIIFFTIIGLGGVFAATLVTVTAQTHKVLVILQLQHVMQMA